MSKEDIFRKKFFLPKIFDIRPLKVDNTTALQQEAYMSIPNSNLDNTNESIKEHPDKPNRISNKLKTLGYWFLMMLCGFCGGYMSSTLITLLFFSHDSSIEEYMPRCPKGYIAWETQEYFPTGPVNLDGDSILIFEKSIRSGCRLFVTSTDTPEMIKKSTSSDPIVDTIYHSTILGRIDLRKNKISFLDTTRWTTTCKKQEP